MQRTDSAVSQNKSYPQLPVLPEKKAYLFLERRGFRIGAVLFLNSQMSWHNYLIFKIILISKKGYRSRLHAQVLILEIATPDLYLYGQWRKRDALLYEGLPMFFDRQLKSSIPLFVKTELLVQMCSVTPLITWNQTIFFSKKLFVSLIGISGNTVWVLSKKC